ncbi:hypothetical protein FLONG3_10349 [Fusarium longipes]|uniref:Uncharacterized protein n=1 Tax=Fusarium longipes TaxID=694270 RepID=A0A395RPH3_9HYPO|nr:hypothetical protein FLONG3_10349 [Fusarium longipes]
MPFVGEDVHSGRKRRYSDDDERSVYPAYPPGDSRDIYYRKQRPELSSRKVAMAKRPRMTDDDILDVDGLNNPLNTSPRSRRLSQLKALQVQPVTKTRITNALVAPCHICHRRPTKKTHLDSFADCQGCGERTCFVCIRLSIWTMWMTNHIITPLPRTNNNNRTKDGTLLDTRLWYAAAAVLSEVRMEK